MNMMDASTHVQPCSTDGLSAARFDPISDYRNEVHFYAANVSNQTTTHHTMLFDLSISSYVSAFVYWLTFVFGCLGNMFVLIVTAWNYISGGKRLAVFTFTCSLAISDLGLLLGVTWINALLSIDPTWRFGDGICKFYTMWRSLTSFSSIWILMSIAVDRFRSYL
jgi:7 transmembrane receptor (rhodopsin family)